MDLLHYEALIAQLLKDHFGCCIADTHLTNSKIDLARLNGVAPYEVVNQQAVDLDLLRTDLATGNAFPRALLGNADQYRATLKLSLQSVRAGLDNARTDMALLH